MVLFAVAAIALAQTAGPITPPHKLPEFAYFRSWHISTCRYQPLYYTDDEKVVHPGWTYGFDISAQKAAHRFKAQLRGAKGWQFSFPNMMLPYTMKADHTTGTKPDWHLVTEMAGPDDMFPSWLYIWDESRVVPAPKK